MNSVGNECLVSVDGTDFKIYEHKPFWKGWFSHKFRGPGVRYEVGLCIQTGWIVWIHGPFPCGAWPDLKIFRKALMGMLPIGEKVHADAGYKGESCIVIPSDDMSPAFARMAAMIRGRHETVNHRFKMFNILHRVFRHDVDKHQPVFGAVAVITQLALQNGEPLYSVEYAEEEYNEYAED